MTTYLMILDLHKGQVEHVERFDSRDAAADMAIDFLGQYVASVPLKERNSLRLLDITTFGQFTVAITQSIN